MQLLFQQLALPPACTPLHRKVCKNGVIKEHQWTPAGTAANGDGYGETAAQQRQHRAAPSTVPGESRPEPTYISNGTPTLSHRKNTPLNALGVVDLRPLPTRFEAVKIAFGKRLPSTSSGSNSNSLAGLLREPAEAVDRTRQRKHWCHEGYTLKCGWYTCPCLGMWAWDPRPRRGQDRCLCPGAQHHKLAAHASHRPSPPTRCASRPSPFSPWSQVQRRTCFSACCFAAWASSMTVGARGRMYLMFARMTSSLCGSSTTTATITHQAWLRRCSCTCIRGTAAEERGKGQVLTRAL